MGEEPKCVCLNPGVWGLLHPQVSSTYRGPVTREVLAGPPATWPHHSPHPKPCFPHDHSLYLLHLLSRTL